MEPERADYENVGPTDTVYYNEFSKRDGVEYENPAMLTSAPGDGEYAHLRPQDTESRDGVAYTELVGPHTASDEYIQVN